MGTVGFDAGDRIRGDTVLYADTDDVNIFRIDGIIQILIWLILPLKTA